MRRNTRSKRNNAKPRKWIRKNKINDRLLVPFSVTKTISFAGVSTGQVITIDNNLTSRMTSLSDWYTFYKYLKLKITIMPYADTSTVNNYIAVSYNPDTTGIATTPAFGDAVQWLASVVVPSMKSINTTLNVSRSILLGTQNRLWSVGSSDNESVIQGVVHIKPNATSTTTLIMKITGIMQLVTSTPGTSFRQKGVNIDNYYKTSDNPEEPEKCEVSRTPENSLIMPDYMPAMLSLSREEMAAVQAMRCANRHKPD